MLLLGVWYSLSDKKVEESVNENLSMMRFCDLVNRQLVEHKVVIKNGADKVKNRIQHNVGLDVIPQYESL